MVPVADGKLLSLGTLNAVREKSKAIISNKVDGFFIAFGLKGLLDVSLDINIVKSGTC